MKVAVIGAGLSGLACAHELERHGIMPAVFEQRHRPGELFDHCSAVLELFSRPHDPLGQLAKEFNLRIQPIGKVSEIIMKSPGKRVAVRGNLGYFILRGHDPVSIESQLHRKIKSRIVTNTKADCRSLSRCFDYVVAANGNYDFSRKSGIWSPVYPAKLIGGTVIGKFRTDRMLMWVDTRYTMTAYAYLAPMENKRAFLGLVAPGSTAEEARRRWRRFWEMEGHPYHPINEIVVEHNAGFVYPHQVGNVLFAGVAGGFMEPFLGFGALSCMKSGVLAARAIATGRKYEDLLFQLKEDMKHSLVLRNLFNKVGNDGYDRLMGYLGFPGLKQLIYNTNLDVARMGTALAAHVKKMAGRLKNK